MNNKLFLAFKNLFLQNLWIMLMLCSNSMTVNFISFFHNHFSPLVAGTKFNNRLLVLTSENIAYFHTIPNKWQTNRFDLIPQKNPKKAIRLCDIETISLCKRKGLTCFFFQFNVKKLLKFDRKAKKSIFEHFELKNDVCNPSKKIIKQWFFTIQKNNQDSDEFANLWVNKIFEAKERIESKIVTEESLANENKLLEEKIQQIIVDVPTNRNNLLIEKEKRSIFDWNNQLSSFLDSANANAIFSLIGKFKETALSAVLHLIDQKNHFKSSQIKKEKEDCDIEGIVMQKEGEFQGCGVQAERGRQVYEGGGVRIGGERQIGGSIQEGRVDVLNGEVKDEKDEEDLEEIYFIKDKNMIIRQTSSANKAKLYNIEFNALSFIMEKLPLLWSRTFRLQVPLASLVLYKGYNVLCLSRMGLVNQDKLVFGFRKKGGLIFEENSSILSQLSLLALSLNLQPQKIELQSNKFLTFPLGIFACVYKQAIGENEKGEDAEVEAEGRRVEGGKGGGGAGGKELEEGAKRVGKNGAAEGMRIIEDIYYLEGVGDLFPLQVDGKMNVNVKKRFRKEFLEGSHDKLCSTSFLARNPTKENHINDILCFQASSSIMSSTLLPLSSSLFLLPFSLLHLQTSSSPQLLLHSLIPSFSSFIPFSSFLLPSTSFSSLLHKYGLNLRFLGILAEKTEKNDLKKILKADMAARAIKKIFKRKLVELVERENKKFEIKDAQCLSPNHCSSFSSLSSNQSLLPPPSLSTLNITLLTYTVSFFNSIFFLNKYELEIESFIKNHFNYGRKKENSKEEEENKEYEQEKRDQRKNEGAESQETGEERLGGVEEESRGRIDIGGSRDDMRDVWKWKFFHENVFAKCGVRMRLRNDSWYKNEDFIGFTQEIKSFKMDSLKNELVQQQLKRRIMSGRKDMSEDNERKTNQGDKSYVVWNKSNREEQFEEGEELRRGIVRERKNNKTNDERGEGREKKEEEERREEERGRSVKKGEKESRKEEREVKDGLLTEKNDILMKNLERELLMLKDPTSALPYFCQYVLNLIEETEWEKAENEILSFFITTDPLSPQILLKRFLLIQLHIGKKEWKKAKEEWEEGKRLVEEETREEEDRGRMKDEGGEMEEVREMAVKGEQILIRKEEAREGRGGEEKKRRGRGKGKGVLYGFWLLVGSLLWIGRGRNREGGMLLEAGGRCIERNIITKFKENIKQNDKKMKERKKEREKRIKGKNKENEAVEVEVQKNEEKSREKELEEEEQLEDEKEGTEEEQDEEEEEEEYEEDDAYKEKENEEIEVKPEEEEEITDEYANIFLSSIWLTLAQAYHSMSDLVHKARYYALKAFNSLQPLKRKYKELYIICLGILSNLTTDHFKKAEYLFELLNFLQTIPPPPSSVFLPSSLLPPSSFLPTPLFPPSALLSSFFFSSNQPSSFLLQCGQLCNIFVELIETLRKLDDFDAIFAIQARFEKWLERKENLEGRGQNESGKMRERQKETEERVVKCKNNEIKEGERDEKKSEESGGELEGGGKGEEGSKRKVGLCCKDYYIHGRLLLEVLLKGCIKALEHDERKKIEKICEKLKSVLEFEGNQIGKEGWEVIKFQNFKEIISKIYQKYDNLEEKSGINQEKEGEREGFEGNRESMMALFIKRILKRMIESNGHLNDEFFEKEGYSNRVNSLVDNDFKITLIDFERILSFQEINLSLPRRRL